MEARPDSTTSSVTVDSMVAEGKAAQIAGDAYAARQHFRHAIEADPQCVAAWIGLAGTVRPYREKREHLERALAIDPGNAEARAVLAQVEARLAAGEVLAPAGVQREPAPPATIAEATSPTLAEPSQATSDTVAADTTLVCYLHPDRETGLRCTSCDRPICAKCATPAAVGQLCPECVKVRRPVNYQVTAGHSAMAAGVTIIFSGIITWLGLWLLDSIGFFSLIIAFLLGPAIGELLVRLLDRLTHGKRGRPMQLAVGIGYGIGMLLLLVILPLLTSGMPLVLIGIMLAKLPLSMYLLSAVVLITAITRLR